MNYLRSELLHLGGRNMDLKQIMDRYQTAYNTINRSFNALLKEQSHSDITSDQYITLDHILRHQPCTSTEIAATFGIGKSAVSAQIHRLFMKGLIAKAPDKNDRRIVYLYVTEQGKQLVEYTEVEIQKELANYLSHFNDDEIYSFIQLLEKLASLMEKK
jgi:DNA-binding MarR family transcriptional regulator